LLDTLWTLIEAYEAEHYSIPNCSGSDVLAYLIEEHGLSLSDLPEISTSETIEAILNKYQGLTLSQIQQLAQRFKVQAQVFLDEKQFLGNFRRNWRNISIVWVKIHLHLILKNQRMIQGILNG
jgi:hypothetical protein